MNPIDILGKVVGDKRRWKQYRARIDALPASHRAAADALQRYAFNVGGIADGETVLRMADDLADLFEQSVAQGSTVRDVVGDDPVEFADDFCRTYVDGSWVVKEKARLVQAIDDAESAS